MTSDREPLERLQGLEPHKFADFAPDEYAIVREEAAHAHGLTPKELDAEVATIKKLRGYQPAPMNQLSTVIIETDYANGERLVKRHGHAIKWTPHGGDFVWDGRRFERFARNFDTAVIG